MTWFTLDSCKYCSLDFGEPGPLTQTGQVVALIGPTAPSPDGRLPAHALLLPLRAHNLTHTRTRFLSGPPRCCSNQGLEVIVRTPPLPPRLFIQPLSVLSSESCVSALHLSPCCPAGIQTLFCPCPGPRGSLPPAARSLVWASPDAPSIPPSESAS